MKLPTFALVCLWPLLLGACSTATSVVWTDDNPPRLRNGTVTVRTRWTHKEGAQEDIRRVRARDGKVTAEFISPARGHLLGDVPANRWEEFWNTLMSLRPFTAKARFDVELDDPRAEGPYHVMSLQLESRFHEFSAQARRNVFGVMQTGDIKDRLRYTDLVSELVSEFATTVITPEIKSDAEPKK
ncbi:MAG: hypothetical protein CMJ83_22200 [Planctomycetes bacterium]|nr:hypothetical protein [Planctomycetota bacterium]